MNWNFTFLLVTSGVLIGLMYALIALGCAAVLHGFCMIGPSHIPRWTASLGKISYGLYVYHFLVMALTSVFLNRLHIHPFSGASAAVSLLVTIVAAKLSYAWLESPFLRLKRRFEIVHSRPI